MIKDVVKTKSLYGPAALLTERKEGYWEGVWERGTYSMYTCRCVRNLEACEFTPVQVSRMKSTLNTQNDHRSLLKGAAI